MYAASLEVSTVLHEGFGMSMDLMVQAMKIKVGNPLRKLVLLKLADNASDLGECWPSYQHIADQCEISKRSVMNHIEALCECGLIKKELRTGPKGNSSNVYQLNLRSAGDSPGGSANRSLPGAGDSLPGAGDSPGGSAGAAPRISHSFEPVIESVNEPINILAHRLTPLHRLVLQNRIIPLNSKQPGRTTPSEQVAIPRRQPGKPGKPA